MVHRKSFPSVPEVGRMTTGPVKVGNYEIPPGHMLFASLTAVMQGEDFFKLCTGWGGHLFRRFCLLFSESVPMAVGLYCSCHAAQASKGNF